ncbi:hypothetical protein VOM14_13300 [Paraburkholderia sp. MPAMCS5]|uniref:hypothetical protein n=1 Tax=Paraburkholderia sp. MPAMCS5 TaxID=3112563 RepID=UPI002E17183A|nr:hypothetical protein [Paraburkholderia sp. MPAMCS5]
MTYLVAQVERLVREYEEVKADSARTEIRQRIGALKQSILDVRAGRVDAFKSTAMEITVKH